LLCDFNFDNLPLLHEEEHLFTSTTRSSLSETLQSHRHGGSSVST